MNINYQLVARKSITDFFVTWLPGTGMDLLGARELYVTVQKAAPVITKEARVRNYSASKLESF